VKKAWLTYAWVDDADDDVLYIVQKLRKSRLDVRFDKSDIPAGTSLWQHISEAITDKSKSDGWLIYATEQAFKREAVLEEYDYAIDRALHSRGRKFPIIAILPGLIDRELLPAGIRVRLYVSLTDPRWIERVIKGMEGQPIDVMTREIQDYAFSMHNPSFYDGIVIEVRPRAGTWSPFIAAIPLQ
jgi:hypothetical protein